MSNGSLLPCLWTKTNPDSTWNVMFLISFSENILFSLAAKRRDREEREKKGGGRGGGQKLNKEKSWKVHLLWICASVGRACEVKTGWLSVSGKNKCPSLQNTESTHPLKKKACRGGRWSTWLTNCKILFGSLLKHFAFSSVHFKRLRFSHATNLAVFDHLFAVAMAR